MRSMIEANGGKLITMQAPVAKDDGRYRQLTVNVQLSGTIFTLRKILHAIETNQPALFVENLQVRSQVPANFKPNPGAEPDVYMQMDVSGFAGDLTSAPGTGDRDPLGIALRILGDGSEEENQHDRSFAI